LYMEDVPINNYCRGQCFGIFIKACCLSGQ